VYSTEVVYKSVYEILMRSDVLSFTEGYTQDCTLSLVYATTRVYYRW
jgi:hypothetical protein